MVSVVHGPGKREGQEAELPPRPASLWESLSAHTAGMEPKQLRRTSMLLMYVACGWHLEDIGKLFDLHKGHVSREIERARQEVAKLLQDQDPAAGGHHVRGRRRVINVRLTDQEADVLGRLALVLGVRKALILRNWLLVGGLREAVDGPEVKPTDDDPFDGTGECEPRGILNAQ